MEMKPHSARLTEAWVFGDHGNKYRRGCESRGPALSRFA